jgi:hypothetical protein
MARYSCVNATKFMFKGTKGESKKKRAKIRREKKEGDGEETQLISPF